MSPRPVYFDCDTGIDDALALVYLMASPEITLAGIGTVSGNIDARRAALNTLDLLALGGRDDVPVAVGAMDPLTHSFDGGVPHIHGHNGVGDVELPHTDRRPEAESAADMLVRLAHQHPGELDVIAIGPLTNLAIALKQDPSIAELVREVIIMGGAPGLSFDQVFGWIFAPVAWLLGVPWHEAGTAGNFIGQKTVLNEFVAFSNFGPLAQAGSLDPKTVLITTFALCGFANFGSIAILVGSLGALVPERRHEVAKYGLLALLAATMTNLLNAAIVGVVGS